MNSEDFILQSSLEANYLSIQVNGQEDLDEIAVKVIAQDCPEFLIPFRLTALNDTVTLKYKLINTISLEYANMTLPRNLFVQMYVNLLTPFVKGRDWFLDYHHLCIDAKYVFMDKHSNRIFFVYVPVKSFRNTDEEILDFFKKVFMNITITDDKDFQVQMFRFFGGGQVTLAGLYQLLTEAQRAPLGAVSYAAKQQPVQRPAPQPASPSRPMMQSAPQPQPVLKQGPAAPQAAPVPSAQKQPAQKQPQPGGMQPQMGRQSEGAQSQPANPVWNENPEDEVMQALFGDKKKSKPVKGAAEEKVPVEKKRMGLFGGKKKETKVKQPIPATGLDSVPVQGNMVSPVMAGGPAAGGAGYVPMFVMDGAASDETEVFSDAPVSGGAWLELIDFSQVGAMPRIELNFSKPYITIGRISSDEIKPDVAFPSDFKRIGRQHARIEKREGAFFIIDLGSVNHTMLNGQVLVPNQPYQLREGMELAFTVTQPIRYRVHV